MHSLQTHTHKISSEKRTRPSRKKRRQAKHCATLLVYIGFLVFLLRSVLCSVENALKRAFVNFGWQLTQLIMILKSFETKFFCFVGLQKYLYKNSREDVKYYDYYYLVDIFGWHFWRRVCVEVVVFAMHMCGKYERGFNLYIEFNCKHCHSPISHWNVYGLFDLISMIGNVWDR